MNRILLTFLILYCSFAKAQEKTNSGTSTDKWCTDIRSILSVYKADKSKLIGRRLYEDEGVVTYVCPLNIAGCDSIRTKVYSETMRQDRVIAYFKPKTTFAESEKLYNSLAAKLISCFEENEEIEFAYELFYEKAHQATYDEDFQIMVGLSGKLTPKRVGAVTVLIEFP